jgi:hypothetical protein
MPAGLVQIVDVKIRKRPLRPARPFDVEGRNLAAVSRPHPFLYKPQILRRRRCFLYLDSDGSSA